MLLDPRMFVAISATSVLQNYSCKAYIATTPVSTRNVHLAITPPANQSAVTAFITSYTSLSGQTSNFMTKSDTNGNPQLIDVNGEYQIYSQLCTPSTFENGSDIEFVVHGYVENNECQFGRKVKKLT